PMRLERGEGSNLVGAHQSAIADYIHRDDGGEATFDGGVLHGLLPPLWIGERSNLVDPTQPLSPLEPNEPRSPIADRVDQPKLKRRHDFGRRQIRNPALAGSVG